MSPLHMSRPIHAMSSSWMSSSFRASALLLAAPLFSAVVEAQTTSSCTNVTTARTTVCTLGDNQELTVDRTGSITTATGRGIGAGSNNSITPRDPGLFSFRDNDAPANSEPTSFNIDAPAQQTILRTTRPSPQFGEAHTTVAFIDSSLLADFSRPWKGIWRIGFFGVRPLPRSM